jgi:hypothetical protein
MNGRCYADSITVQNWYKKKRILDAMLMVLSETERVKKESGKIQKMFSSVTTSQTWRISIRSAIALTEEQLGQSMRNRPKRVVTESPILLKI